MFMVVEAREENGITRGPIAVELESASKGLGLAAVFAIFEWVGPAVGGYQWRTLVVPRNRKNLMVALPWFLAMWE